MEGVSCPDCKGTKLERYGKTKAGLQKYRCLDERNIGCRRQLVAGSDHLLDPEQKKIILSLLEQDTPPKTIRKAFPGVSLRWLYELRRRAVSSKIEEAGKAGDELPRSKLRGIKNTYKEWAFRSKLRGINPDEIKDVAGVVAYLTTEGWQISTASFYRHLREGKVRAHSGGYTLRALRKYARLFLKRRLISQSTSQGRFQRSQVWKTL